MNGLPRVFETISARGNSPEPAACVTEAEGKIGLRHSSEEGVDQWFF